MKTVADLKQYFEKGGRIQLVQQSWSEIVPELLSTIRKPIKCQPEAVKLEGGLWLDYPQDSAFEVNEDIFTVFIYRHKIATPSGFMRYKLINKELI